MMSCRRLTFSARRWVVKPLVQALGGEAAVDHGHVHRVSPGIHQQQVKRADGQGQEPGDHRQGEFAVAGDQDRRVGPGLVDLEQIRRHRPGQLQRLHHRQDFQRPDRQGQGLAPGGAEGDAVLGLQAPIQEPGRHLGAIGAPQPPAFLRGQVRGDIDPIHVEIRFQHGDSPLPTLSNLTRLAARVNALGGRPRRKTGQARFYPCQVNPEVAAHRHGDRYLCPLYLHEFSFTKNYAIMFSTSRSADDKEVVLKFIHRERGQKTFLNQARSIYRIISD